MESGRLNLSRVIEFSQLMLRFQEVVRAFYLPTGKRENDVEHSYHLAMMAWYLNSASNLGLSSDRLIRYALCHDLVEAYVGDVHAFDEKGRIGKEAREAAAVAHFSDDFPEASDMIPLMRDYLERSDAESKFVYALDKVMPMLMIYLDDGRTWRDDGLSFQTMHQLQSVKIAESKPVLELYMQLVHVFENRPDLFAPLVP